MSRPVGWKASGEKKGGARSAARWSPERLFGGRRGTAGAFGGRGIGSGGALLALLSTFMALLGLGFGCCCGFALARGQRLRIQAALVTAGILRQGQSCTEKQR